MAQSFYCCGRFVQLRNVANSAAATWVKATYTTSGGVIKPGIMVLEYSGRATSAVADGSVNNASGASVTTSTSGHLTTSNANDILIFASDAAGDQSQWTAGIPNNSVTTGNSGSNKRMAVQWETVASFKTNTTTTMTYGSSAWNGIFLPHSSTRETSRTDRWQGLKVISDHQID